MLTVENEILYTSFYFILFFFKFYQIVGANNFLAIYVVKKINSKFHYQ